MLTKDQGICIRAVDFSETSQITTFFAQQTGKFTAIAKGSKRPKSAFDGPIEILSHGSIVFSQTTKDKMATLTEFRQKPFPTGTFANMFVLNCCLFASELLSRMTDDYDPHPKLFEAFSQFLQDVCKVVDSSEIRREILALLVVFQLSLLKEVGLQPVLKYCVNCKKNFEPYSSRSEVYFSSIANGLICKDCEASFSEKTRLSKQAATGLIRLQKIAELTLEDIKEIERVMVYHFTELLGSRPKMAKYVLAN